MKINLKKLSLENICDIAVLAAIFGFLFYFFKPGLIFSKTITTGGDTSSHYYPVWYLKNYLLPNFKIIGWSPGWFAGFPMFQFYFPLVFVLMALLGFLIPLEIAFKAGTILGIFMLPVCAYSMARLLKIKFPGPALFSLSTIIFLFNEGNTMWGGNIPSTLAGEFSYSFSLALTLLYFGLIYKGLEEKKYKILNSIILALIILSHAYTGLWAISGTLILIFLKGKKELRKNINYTLPILGLTFFLISFWLIPFLAKLEFTTTYNLPWALANNEKMIPQIFWPLLAFSPLGLTFIFWKKLKNGLYLLALLFLILPLSQIVYFIGGIDVRFVPLAQIILLLISAFGISHFLNIKKIKLKTKYIAGLLLIITPITFFWTYKNVSFIDYWIKWNYSGFEEKSNWNDFKNLNNYLKNNGENTRLMWEHSYDNTNAAGTTRAFELLPFFAEKNTLEGVNMESSATSPFVFYMQSQVSKNPSCPFWFKYQCESWNPQEALKRLELFNIEYLITTTKIENTQGYSLEKEFGIWNLYKIENDDNKYVTIPKYEPVFTNYKNWKDTSYDWFKNNGNLDVPIIFDKNTKENIDLGNLSKKQIENENQVEGEKAAPQSGSSLDLKERVENIRVENEKITFRTKAIGKPHLIKISYNPNWKVKGAQKIYLASPSFMIVYPQEEEVEIYYGSTWPDNLGRVLTGFGLIFIFYSLLPPKFKKRFNLVKRFSN